MASNKKLNRKGIGKTKRFKIFERDSFKCSYCGLGVDQGKVLEVDHVIPVAKGGTDEDANLVTACYDCNRGKRDKVVLKGTQRSLDGVIESLEEELALTKEYEEQLKRYFALKTKMRKVEDPVLKMINKTLYERLGYELNDYGYKSFKKLYEKCGVDMFLEATEVVAHKEGLADLNARHKYLCGVMNNKYKEEHDPLYQEEREVKQYFLHHPNKRGGDYYVDWKMKPYVQAMGSSMVKPLIDHIFETKRAPYFQSLLELCEEKKDEYYRSIDELLGDFDE